MGHNSEHVSFKFNDSKKPHGIPLKIGCFVFLNN